MIPLKQLYTTVYSLRYNLFIFYYSLRQRRYCLINSNSYSHFEFTGRFQFLMMVMTHGLNIPEEISPLSHQGKSRYMIHALLSFPYLLVACVRRGHSGRQGFKQLRVVSFESTGRGKDGGRRPNLGPGPQSCGEMMFCCGPWGSHGKALKYRPSLHFKSFAGIEIPVRSESLLLMWQ